jgi:hypothetical protein
MRRRSSDERRNSCRSLVAEKLTRGLQAIMAGVAMRVAQWILAVFVFVAGLAGYLHMSVFEFRTFQCASAWTGAGETAFCVGWMLVSYWILRDTKWKRDVADVIYVCLCFGWLQISFGLFLLRDEFVRSRFPTDYATCAHSPFWLASGCVSVAGLVLVHLALRRRQGIHNMTP